MCERAGIILSAIFAIVFSCGTSTALASATSPDHAEIKSRFDLPAEPLDKALRDFAVQANCNISYEPSIVAGLQAPAIKGEFTTGNVLSLLLAGTKLHAVNVNEDTIQILGNSAASKLLVTAVSNGYDSSRAGVVRVASATPDAPVPGASSADADSNGSATADEKSNNKKELEEIVVTGTHIRGVSTASPVIEIGREEIDRSGTRRAPICC